MTHQHLNEEDVQSVAIHGEGFPDQSWRDCPDCRERVEAYRLLYGTLAGLEPELPGFDLERVVMAQLPPVEAPSAVMSRARSRRAIYFLVASCLPGLPCLLLLVPASIWQKYFLAQNSWGYWLVVVTVMAVAAWAIWDAVGDYRRKLRRLGLE